MPGRNARSRTNDASKVDVERLLPVVHQRAPCIRRSEHPDPPTLFTRMSESHPIPVWNAADCFLHARSRTDIPSVRREPKPPAHPAAASVQSLRRKAPLRVKRRTHSLVPIPFVPPVTRTRFALKLISLKRGKGYVIRHDRISSEAILFVGKFEDVVQFKRDSQGTRR